MKRFHAVVAAAVLGGVLLAAFPNQLGGQAAESKTQDAHPSFPKESAVQASKKTLMNDSSDLGALAKSASGTEFSALMNLDGKAGEGAMEMDAAYWFVAIYDHTQCGTDREMTKEALKNRLGFYSYMLGLEADQAAGQIGYARLPASVQAGTRLKDDLRAAKAKLDEIAATLN